MNRLQQSYGEIKRLKIPTIMLSYFLIYMMMSGQFLYLSLFFSEKGLSEQQIGLVMGLPPFIAIAGQYVWSGLADKASSVNKIVLILFAGAVAVLPLFLVSNSFWTLLATTVLYNVFSSSILSTFDTQNLYRAASLGYKFGPLKIPGSFGYLVCVLCMGVIMGINVNNLILWQLVFGVIALFVLPRCPKVTMPRMKRAAFNPMVMLRKPSVLMALLIACVIHMIHGVNSTFFALYLTRDMGAPSSFVGVCSLSSIAVEMTFLAISARLIDRFNTKSLLIGIALLQAARLFAFGFSDSLAIIWLFNGIDGISTVATYFFMVTYFKRVAPTEGKASAQALVSILCSNGAKAVGSMLAPTIFTAVGSIQNAYVFLALLMAATTLIFAVVPVHFVTEDEAQAAEKAQSTL